MARDLLKNAEGRFFRGNLHCHSNRSDDREPEEVVGAYRDKGYDFVCLRPLRGRVRLADDRHTTLARRGLHHDRRGGVEFRSVGGASHLLGDGSRSARRLRSTPGGRPCRGHTAPGTWGLSWSCCTRGSTTSRSRRPKSSRTGRRPRGRDLQPQPGVPCHPGQRSLHARRTSGEGRRLLVNAGDDAHFGHPETASAVGLKFTRPARPGGPAGLAQGRTLLLDAGAFLS